MGTTNNQPANTQKNALLQARFEKQVTTKEIAKLLVKGLDKPRKEIAGIEVKIGKKGTAGQTIVLTTAFTGYNKVRQSINRQTEKFYGEDCFIEIEGNRMEFEGGKFSNNLLKILERAVAEYTSGGDHLNEYADFKPNLEKVKAKFLPNITVVDLLPNVIALADLNKKEVAQVGAYIADEAKFKGLLIEVTEENEA